MFRPQQQQPQQNQQQNQMQGTMLPPSASSHANNNATASGNQNLTVNASTGSTNYSANAGSSSTPSAAPTTASERTMTLAPSSSPPTNNGNNSNSNIKDNRSNSIDHGAGNAANVIANHSNSSNNNNNNGNKNLTAVNASNNPMTMMMTNNSMMEQFFGRGASNGAVNANTAAMMGFPQPGVQTPSAAHPFYLWMMQQQQQQLQQFQQQAQQQFQQQQQQQQALQIQQAQQQGPQQLQVRAQTQQVARSQPQAPGQAQQGFNAMNQNTNNPQSLASFNHQQPQQMQQQQVQQAQAQYHNSAMQLQQQQMMQAATPSATPGMTDGTPKPNENQTASTTPQQGQSNTPVSGTATHSVNPVTGMNSVANESINANNNNMAMFQRFQMMHAMQQQQAQAQVLQGFQQGQLMTPPQPQVQQAQGQYFQMPAQQQQQTQQHQPQQSGPKTMQQQLPQAQDMLHASPHSSAPAAIATTDTATAVTTKTNPRSKAKNTKAASKPVKAATNPRGRKTKCVPSAPSHDDTQAAEQTSKSSSAAAAVEHTSQQPRNAKNSKEINSSMESMSSTIASSSAAALQRGSNHIHHPLMRDPATGKLSTLEEHERMTRERKHGNFGEVAKEGGEGGANRDGNNIAVGGISEGHNAQTMGNTRLIQQQQLVQQQQQQLVQQQLHMQQMNQQQQHTTFTGGNAGYMNFPGVDSVACMPLSFTPVPASDGAPSTIMSPTKTQLAASANTSNLVSSDTDGGDTAAAQKTQQEQLQQQQSKKSKSTSLNANATANLVSHNFSGISCDSATEDDHDAYDGSIMTDEEKIKNNRERNREHAKNTRLRKKAYVDRLKITVDELCRERDTLVSERAVAANLMVEIHSKRVDVLRSFFALRASYTTDQKRDMWSSILDESSFTCRLPVTPYQSFPSSEVQLSNSQRTIVGVDAMMADVASNAVFLDSIVDRTRYPTSKIKFQYTLVTEESVVAGNQVMARWAMETLNAKKCGGRTELHQKGMLFCKFNSAHKIVSLEIMFDVMAFMLQVKMAMGFDNFNDVVIPNTVQTCQKQFDFPMVMTLADRPFTIVQVNERWEKLTGYLGAEVVGKKSCSILQGADTAEKDLNQLMGPVMFKRPACAMLTNYTKTGRRFRNYVTIYPLSTDSNISHYFGLTTFVQWIDADDSVRLKKRSKIDDGGSGDSKPSSNPLKQSPQCAAGSDDNKKPSSPGKDSSLTSDARSSPTSTEAVKGTTASQNEKQSLSSLTSSVSSGSIRSGEGGTEVGTKRNFDQSSPVVASEMAAPATKQKVVEFSIPLTKPRSPQNQLGCRTNVERNHGAKRKDRGE